MIFAFIRILKIIENLSENIFQFLITAVNCNLSLFYKYDDYLNNYLTEKFECERIYYEIYKTTKNGRDLNNK